MQLIATSCRRRLGRIALALLLGMSGATGCAKKSAPLGTQVRAVGFEGNGPPLGPRSNTALRNAIAHPTPRGLPLLRRKVAFDEETLEADRTRIAVVYAEQGYFDARLVRWRVERVREATDTRPPVVRVVGEIDEGERYPIASVAIDRLEQLDNAPNPPGVDQRFHLDSHTEFKSTTLDTLRNQGHAYATAEAEVRVDRTRQTVDLDYVFEPGPTATFGEVTVEGADAIPSWIVDRAVRIEPGAPYSLKAIEQTRRQLYGLGVFSFVTAAPDLDTEGVVPVTIQVETRKPRSLAGGVGFNLQSGRQEALIRGRFRHLNVGRRLIGFRADAQVGYAVLATSLDELTSLSSIRRGFVADGSVGTRVPGVGFEGFAVDAEAAFERTLTAAFVVNRPTLTLSYAGPLSEILEFAVAYRLRYALYEDVQISDDALRLQTENPDLQRGRYFVTELEQNLILDTRDQPLMPRDGMRHQLTLTQAGRFLGGDYDYVGARLDLRSYEHLGGVGLDNVVVATRLGGGWQLPYGPDERRAVPVAERLYLGGSDSVRGWIFQHLGPYVCDAQSAPCSSDGRLAQDGDSIVPIGGTLAGWSSLELRMGGERFGGAVFTDWGMVWADLDRVSTTPFITPSVGIGGRLVTPAGPIRLDLASRTDNTDLYRSQPRVWVHLGIGEAF